jgi:hypothetical protein
MLNVRDIQYPPSRLKLASRILFRLVTKSSLIRPSPDKNWTKKTHFFPLFPGSIIKTMKQIEKLYYLN